MQTRGKRSRLQREGGFILITLYLLLLLFLAYGSVLITRSFAEIRGAERFQASTQAFYLAEAGVDFAITRLRDDPNWRPGGPVAAATGSYTVTTRLIEDDLGGGLRRFTSTGTVTQGAGILATDSVQVILRTTPNPLFRYAAFAERKMKMKGFSVTDSYDSSKGAYGGTNVGCDGDIGTNSTVKKKVQLGGHTTVHGNAEVGPGGDPSKVIDLKKGATITGTQSAAKKPYPSDPVAIPGNLKNGGTLKISKHETKTLPGGIYWYNNIEITGNGQLIFSGPAIVYVSDKVKVSGNGIGAAGDLPPNLIIYVGGEDQDDDDKVQLSGDAQLYAGIYAPRARVKINGHANLYGSIVGRDVKINLKGEAKDEDGDDDDDDDGAGGIHYDEALLKADGGSGAQVQMLSWQEQ